MSCFPSAVLNQYEFCENREVHSTTITLMTDKLYGLNHFKKKFFQLMNK